MTAQQRGQRLNEFVAELLRYWGAGRIEANVRSVGEIDVAFAIDGTRLTGHRISAANAFAVKR